MAEQITPGRDQVVADRTTVDRILYNALEHFSKHGYSGASVREITQASQVTKPTLYYYFKNKEELYRRLAEACFNEAYGVLKNAAAKSGSTPERIALMIQDYSRFVKDRFIVARFLHLMDTSPLRDAPETGFNNFTRKAFEQFHGVVSDGVKENLLPAQDVTGVSYCVMSIFSLHIGNLLTRTALPSEMVSVEEALRVVFRQG